jgi:hypothetical protein
MLGHLVNLIGFPSRMVGFAGKSDHQRWKPDQQRDGNLINNAMET